MQVVGSYEHRIGLVVGMPLPCVKLFIATHESSDCHVSRFHIAGNTYVWDADPARFARYFQAVWGLEPDPFDQEGTIREGISRVRAFYESVGIPTHYGELGVRDEDVPALCSTVRRGPDGKAGHFKKLSTEDLEAIYALMR